MSGRLVVDGEALAAVLYAAQSEDLLQIREALRAVLLAPRVPAPQAQPWLSVAEAAARFGVAEKTVRRAVNRGEWPHRRVGRRVLVAASGPEGTAEDTALAAEGPEGENRGNGEEKTA